MPRRPRIQSATGYYHVMARGNNKRAIFDTDTEKVVFLKLLSKAVNRVPLKIKAYCIMNNHFHLLIDTGDLAVIQLTQFMKIINTQFAQYHNGRFDFIGHVFQDRFRSEPIEDEAYLKTVLRYIHQNPVKAGLVSKPGEYRWSSYNKYLNPSSDALLDKDLLDIFGSEVRQKIAAFVAFHSAYEDEIYLEDSQEEMAYKKRRAEHMMVKMLEGTMDYPTVVDKCEMVSEISRGTKLPPMQTCELVGVSYSTWKRLRKHSE